MLLCLISCNNNEACLQRVKTLDSLSGALNVKINELKKTDTALINRCVNRYTYYRDFLTQNIQDTITRQEGDAVSRFLSGGKNLETYAINRKIILEQASTVNSRLGKLNTDLKNQSILPEEADTYIYNEISQANKLIGLSQTQGELYFSAIEDYKASLKQVESLIRRHNQGQLPLIIKDSLSL